MQDGAFTMNDEKLSFPRREKRLTSTLEVPWQPAKQMSSHSSTSSLEEWLQRTTPSCCTCQIVATPQLHKKRCRSSQCKMPTTWQCERAMR